MKITSRSFWQFRLQSGLFVLLFAVFCGLIAWLSTQHQWQMDVSANRQNSLSEESLRLLQGIDQPVVLRAFVSPINEQKPALVELLQRYQTAQPLVEVKVINPDTAPEQLREYAIQSDGEVVVELSQRRENLRLIDESHISNAIAKLLRGKEHFIVFLQGHGERNPFGQGNFDYSLMGGRLQERGFQVQTLNLSESPQIPDNTRVLVLADPIGGFLPGEISLLQNYLQQGGNLLWLQEPRQENELEALSDWLHLEFLPGVIVDPTTQLLGLDRVDYALVSDFPRHSITTGLNAIALFPTAGGMLNYLAEDPQAEEWLGEAIVVSQPRSWNETGTLAGEISFGDNPDELEGPLTIGLALSRSVQQDDGALSTQRIFVMADADFIDDQFLGNGSNLDLSMNLFNWLSHDDHLIAISPSPAIDTELNLSPLAQTVIGVTFLLLLPLMLLTSGFVIWYRRRRA